MSRNLLASVFVTYNRVVIKNADDDDNDDDDPRELGSDVTTVKIKDDDEEKMTSFGRSKPRMMLSLMSHDEPPVRLARKTARGAPADSQPHADLLTAEALSDRAGDGGERA